jgi:outer membrane protein assembly factor BamB
MNPGSIPRSIWIAGGVALAAAGLMFWLTRGPDSLLLRVPGTDRGPDGAAGGGGNPVLAGKATRGPGQPSSLPGLWPQFRGPKRDGISEESVRLLRAWPASGPRQLWSVELGEGYAGPAVRDGRVYLMDYDREKKQDALRCLSLADGQEIWRYAYPVPVKRNHGMSRTVPAVTDKIVVAMGPKCHVVCLDRLSGELRWGLDLVRDFGATVPPWYAGQCPLVDGDSVILAPGGNQALLMAVDSLTGSNRWVTPNPRGWRMTHTSIMATEVAGERMYVYCGHNGVAGVSTRTGEILWETTAWKISIATVPSPVILDGGRIFLSGGYNAGSLMLRVKKDGDRFVAETLFKLEPEVFGATQQTPILYQDHLYGVRPDGKFTCLDLQGKPVWVSDSGQQFGLGPFILADGVFLAVNDSGLLRMIEASPAGYKLLAQAKVLSGRESWGPLAIAGGRLLARDLTQMVCLDLTAP